jgi:hypothetical protein
VIRPLLFVLALAAWPTATHGAPQDQADRCVSGEPEPVLDAASPMIHSHVFAITGVRTAEESAVLEPNLPIHVSRAGCAHFSLVYSFSLAARAPLGDSRAWLREASGVMRRIARAETAGFASTLAAALEKQARARSYRYGDPIVITEGYASAVLEVSADSEKTRSVRVAYQVVL